MKYFLDTEFNEFGGDLISLALVREDGASVYLVTDCEKPGAWVKDNVIPILFAGGDAIKIQPDEFGKGIAIFLAGDPAPVIVSDWPDDIRYFCQAVITGPGEMIAVPQLQFVMLRVDAYPTDLEGAVQHNAWWDAMALKRKVLGS